MGRSKVHFGGPQRKHPCSGVVPSNGVRIQCSGSTGGDGDRSEKDDDGESDAQAVQDFGLQLIPGRDNIVG